MQLVADKNLVLQDSCKIILQESYIASLLHYYTCKTLRPLGCDSTIVLAVARLSAPATTTTHSRVIRLRRVLTDHPPSGSSIDPANVAV